MSKTWSLWKKLGVSVLGLLAAFLIVQSVSIGMPIKGRVVDARTGTPLEGVRVLAAWKLHVKTFGGNVLGGAVRLQELVTDADGRYRVPAWFEFHQPLIPFSLYARSVMDFPNLFYFKTGYVPRQWGNAWLGPHGRRMHSFMSVSWPSADREEIALERAPDRTDSAAFGDYLAHFESFERDVVDVSHGSSGVACSWSKRAAMLLALDAAADNLGLDSALDNNRVPIARCNETGAFQ